MATTRLAVGDLVQVDPHASKGHGLIVYSVWGPADFDVASQFKFGVHDVGLVLEVPRRGSIGCRVLVSQSVVGWVNESLLRPIL